MATPSSPHQTLASHQPAVSSASLRWRLDPFDALDAEGLYAILAARVAVFVVEQQCAYQELDGLDRPALHLVARQSEGVVAAYARILPPATRFEQPSIGRVLTTTRYRGIGLGRELMRRSIAAVRERWPDGPVRISAQCQLLAFYREFGFRPDSEVYDEDGIAHVDMVLDSASSDA